MSIVHLSRVVTLLVFLQPVSLSLLQYLVPPVTRNLPGVIDTSSIKRRHPSLTLQTTQECYCQWQGVCCLRYRKCSPDQQHRPPSQLRRCSSCQGYGGYALDFQRLRKVHLYEYPLCYLLKWILFLFRHKKKYYRYHSSNKY